jgi:hypothetical protein
MPDAIEIFLARLGTMVPTQQSGHQIQYQDALIASDGLAHENSVMG